MALFMNHGFILACVVTVVSTCGRKEFEPNKRYEGYRSEKGVGVYGCKKMCVQEGRCKSINYNPSQLDCELVGPSPEEDTVNFKGWSHASNTSFVDDKLESCANVSVPDTSVCVPLSSGNYTIVKKYCVPVAEIPSYAYLTSTVRVVGKTVDFLCTSGYAGVGSPSITCLANGQWSTHTFQCIPDCGQPPYVSSATVQPGATTVGSVRTYICDGYTTVNPSDVTCQSTRQWTTPNFVCDWPFGTYSLLKPLTGCPVGFDSGSRTWHTDDNAMNMMSTPNSLQGYAEGADVEWHFCTVIDPNVTSSEYEWPPGDYCIMSYGGICPSDFNEGYIYWDEEFDDGSTRPKNGTLPDGQFGNNAHIFFCCRNDSTTTSPITLPTSTPFVLFMYSSSECQCVANMTPRIEYTVFEDETDNNGDSASGEAPRREGPPNWIIYYCYYSQTLPVR